MESDYDFEAEQKNNWRKMSQMEKKRHIKYLTLHYKFIQDPTSIDLEQKKWLLRNCDCEIINMPVHYHCEFNLGKFDE